MSEELGWLRLASHLHMSLDRVKMETTSSQFILWMMYLAHDINAFHKEDYYLAQIAAEVRRGIVKDPKNVSIQDFLLKFRIPTKQIQRKVSPKVYLEKLKQACFSLAGLHKRNK